MPPDPTIFLKVLDPDDHQCGGGSASALAGAMAAALVAMVCQLSPEPPLPAQVGFDALAAQARALSDRLMHGARADTLAFQKVSQAYRLPKDNEQARQARLHAIQAAWVEAARAPLDNAASCLALVQMGGMLEGKINPKVGSDLSCALLLARSGLLGCLENVAINLPAIKDPATAAELADESEHLRQALETAWRQRIHPPDQEKVE